MKIGLTYDLKGAYLAAGYAAEAVAEFDSEETIQALIESLERLGHKAVRIGNLFALVKQLSSCQTWDLVFNLAEGLHGRSREAQVPALLEAYGIPYTFSDPLTLAVCLDKAVSKRLVRAAGVATPDFFLVESPDQVAPRLAESGLDFPLLAKPNAEGTGKGVSAASVVGGAAELSALCARLLERHRQPVLVERFLPGREYTVGVLGTGARARVIGVMEIRFLADAEPGVYSFVNKQEYLERMAYAAVPEGAARDQAADLARAAYRALGCRDAGRVDLRADAAGRLHFLELNPLAGLNPVDSDLPILCGRCGLGYDELIAGILDSARERMPAALAGRRPAPDAAPAC